MPRSICLMVMAGLHPSSSSKMLTKRTAQGRASEPTVQHHLIRKLNSTGRHRDGERSCIKQLQVSRKGVPACYWFWGGGWGGGDGRARGSPETDSARRVDVGVEQRRDEFALWRLTGRRNKTKTTRTRQRDGAHDAMRKDRQVNTEQDAHTNEA